MLIARHFVVVILAGLMCWLSFHLCKVLAAVNSLIRCLDPVPRHRPCSRAGRGPVADSVSASAFW